MVHIRENWADRVIEFECSRERYLPTVVKNKWPTRRGGDLSRLASQVASAAVSNLRWRSDSSISSLMQAALFCSRPRAWIALAS